VLVVEDGRIVEDGDPASLALRSETRYRALLDTEAAVHKELWSNDLWRRLQLVEGRVYEAVELRSVPGNPQHRAAGE